MTNEAVLEAFGRVIDSGQYVLGDELEAFEREFADYLGVEHVVGVSSGTDALTLILRALGITGEVLVPALTFIATAEAVVHAGATPVFTDVDPETWVMTPETARPHITDRTEAIIAVDLFGNPAPLYELGGLGLPVVEDACQAAGSEYLDAPCGSLSTAGAFSFYPSKTLACFGDGGAIATDDSHIAFQARLLRHHGLCKGQHLAVGGTHRLDELQAAALRLALPELEGRVERQRERACESDQVETPGGRSSYHRVMQMGDRPEGARVYYEPPLHMQPSMRPYWRRALPFAEEFGRENWLVP